MVNKNIFLLIAVIFIIAVCSFVYINTGSNTVKISESVKPVEQVGLNENHKRQEVVTTKSPTAKLAVNNRYARSHLNKNDVNTSEDLAISAFSDKLDELLNNQPPEARREFINEIVTTLDPSTLEAVINEYRNNLDERSDRRVIARAVLSEINADNMLNIFYEDVIEDEALLPDFVSATYYTGSQNSFDKLMELQEMSFSQNGEKYLKEGALMMYQGNITKKVISHIDTWLTQRGHINSQQEDIVVDFLLQSTPRNISNLVENNLYKFSGKGQEKLQEYIDDSPRRE